MCSKIRAPTEGRPRSSPSGAAVQGRGPRWARPATALWQVDRLSKMIPVEGLSPVSVTKALADEPRLREAAGKRWSAAFWTMPPADRGPTATPRPMPPAW